MNDSHIETLITAAAILIGMAIFFASCNANQRICVEAGGRPQIGVLCAYHEWGGG